MKKTMGLALLCAMQALNGYTLVNLRVKHELSRHFDITAGVDNVFDKTYAVTNTYKDLTLLFDGAGNVMLTNEPGRYFYVNTAYRF